jgi:FolB domain-containing protein
MVSRKRKIFIHNFEMMASIGVYENERKNKQKIIINLDILLTNSSEPKADDLMETQDYSQFRNEIKNIVQSQHFQFNQKRFCNRCYCKNFKTYYLPRR